MKFQRVFTRKLNHTDIEFEKRTSEITTGWSKTNTIEVTVPKFWSEVASDIIAQKYFRKSESPKRCQWKNH